MNKIKPYIEEINVTANGPKIFEVFKNDKMPIFLDSALIHKEIGRYSFIVSNPFLTIKSKKDRIELIEGGSSKIFRGNSLTYLEKIFSEFKIEFEEGYPPFQGGAAGYLSYDLGRQIEKLPDLNEDDLDVPDYYFGFYDKGVAIDRIKNKVYIFATGLPLKGKERINKAKNDLIYLRKKISSGFSKESTAIKDNCKDKFTGKMEKHFTREEYCQIIQKTKEYIAAGDIFQANITQRFAVELNTTPWNLYKRLREINPAPFAAYLDFGDLAIASSSPERFIKISGLSIETRPIKGTRPRGKNPEEDLKFKNELINSEKDKAELVMIVDLERNDLGRICSTGSVKVKKLFSLEEYATVYHLVSTITGELKSDVSIADVLRATFPGGSITGAPKIRAMEIIEELEPVKRGIYTGAIGYLGFNGESDLNIVIRTFVIKNKKAYFQVGGGIVADSIPVQEYEETLHKAEALKRSIGL